MPSKSEIVKQYTKTERAFKKVAKKGAILRRYPEDHSQAIDLIQASCEKLRLLLLIAEYTLPGEVFSLSADGSWSAEGALDEFGYTVDHMQDILANL